MAGRETILENLGFMRLYRKMNNFALRVRQQFSSHIRRRATTRGSPAPAVHVASAPSPSPKVESVNSGAATTIISNGISPAPPPLRPQCHLENKSKRANFECLIPSLVPKFTSRKAKKFKFFTALPAELRVLIWQAIAAFERVVEIQYIDDTQDFRRSTSSRPPAILHVCRESRIEALQVYQLCLGRPRSMYLNFRSDILFFRVAELSQIWQQILRPNRLWREQLQFVRRIAITHIEPGNLRFMAKTMCTFPNLEELVILWAEDAHRRPFEGRGMNYIESIPGHRGKRRNSSWRSAMRWKRKIEKEFWWENVKEEEPVVSVRHWCRRSIREW